MRCKRKPGLEDQSDDTCPIKQKAHLEMHLHIVKSDVINNKRERVQERKYKKGVSYPSMEYLEPLVGDACQ
jgi:hypothetical protein